MPRYEPPGPTRVGKALDAALDALEELPPPLRRTSLRRLRISDLHCRRRTAARTSLARWRPTRGCTIILAEDGSDDDPECWQRGELDLTMWRLPPGRD